MDTSYVGKWMIFEAPEKVDAAWEKIRKATEEGRLGISAKVRTARPEKEGSPHDITKSRVICVYTKDWRDEGDVMRVREELRKMGFGHKLSYKSDADTMAG